MAPGERIKCLLQVQQAHADHGGKARFAGPVDCAKQLYREGGIRSIYKGTGCNSSARRAGQWHVLCELRVATTGPHTERRQPLGPEREGDPVCRRGYRQHLKGTYPNGIRDVFRELMKNEGVRALYKGAAPVMLRAFPANAACFMGYEVAMKFLNWAAPNL
ncbi:hypothetical protein MTO96_019526 [Rhipicephalus appendiculatus]